VSPVSYVDTSAVVKLLVSEPESSALTEWWRSNSALVSSELLTTELLRTIARAAPNIISHAQVLIKTISLRRIDTHVLQTAGQLKPATLRTLDAIHLATALEFVPNLESLATYDDRMAEAARSLGIVVVTPR
jgi:predicted nucleic acid-binding protein